MEHFEEVRQELLLEVKNVVTTDEIPLDLVINFDQTGINYIPVSSWWRVPNMYIVRMIKGR